MICLTLLSAGTDYTMFPDGRWQRRWRRRFNRRVNVYRRARNSGRRRRRRREGGKPANAPKTGNGAVFHYTAYYRYTIINPLARTRLEKKTSSFVYFDSYDDCVVSAYWQRRHASNVNYNNVPTYCVKPDITYLGFMPSNAITSSAQITSRLHTVYIVPTRFLCVRRDNNCVLCTLPCARVSYPSYTYLYVIHVFTTKACPVCGLHTIQ